MEIRWIPESKFIMYIQQCRADNKAELMAIDAKNRWVVECEDGVKRIVRPKADE